MRQVLIVSPHFPPTNAADHQRVRMALPYFEQFGWQPTVLAVRPEYVEGVQDPLLVRTVPDSVRVVRTKALPTKWTRKIGVGSLAHRARRQLRCAGEELLRQEHFDVVFFSTTEFPILTQGQRWRRRLGVPYVLDIQDPWVSDYYHEHRHQHRPGGKFKYAFSQWLARRSEPGAVGNADHIVCVSASYAEDFRRRYPQVPASAYTVLPFGAPELDFAILQKNNVTQSVFDPHDGYEHWVYVGRGGADMAFAVRSFFLALKRYLDEGRQSSSRLRIHFVGTDYAPGDRARKTIEPLAIEQGVQNVITEQTERLPYFVALQCLKDAHALFILGSNDPGYTASKLYPYILAKKPLLAVFHANSSVVDVLRTTGAGKLVTFEKEDDLNRVSSEIYEQWFAQLPATRPATDWNSFAPYTAEAMTRKLCDVFNKVGQEIQ